MDFTSFVRKPFKIEAVQITEENVDEAAVLLGVLREKADGTKYIEVDRRLVPNVYVLTIQLGSWMTRMGKNIRCYNDAVFRSQFIPMSADLDDIIAYFANKKDVMEDVPVTG